MEALDLLNPREIYIKKLKDQHKNNAEAFFDELTNKSNVNIEQNKETIKNYKNFQNLAKQARKKENSMAFLKGFLIFLIIASFIAAVVLLVLTFTNDPIDALLIVIGSALIIVAIILIILVNKKVIPELNKRKAYRMEMENSVEKLKMEGYAQMAPLNSLFDYNMAAILVNKTCPLIQMDKYFDLEKYEYLHEKYGFNESQKNNESVVFVQSGSIEGNPFLVQKIKHQDMVDRTYTGSLTIYWTESVYSDGKRQTVTRSQTLTASVIKPEPRYYYTTWLVYGNDAAGKLSFSRKPSGVSGKKDKEIDKIVKKGEKKLDDLVEETLTDDKPGAYTKLGNVEFDVLFGAQDRDNEVEFRLLFTPLAQKGMLELIKEPDPYGDDFYFIKENNLNYIRALHTDSFDMNADPSIFEGFDYEVMKQFFIDYQERYFKSLFFNLAPVLTIPLYQQQKPVEYIYKRNYVSNFTTFEHEVMANSFSTELLRPVGSSTDLILKTSLKSRNDRLDNVIITAFSFVAEPRVSYIPVYGGDGRMHDVPVHWIEYIPTYTTHEMGMSEQQLTRKEFKEKTNLDAYSDFMNKYAKGNGVVYKNGLLSLLLSNSMNSDDINILNSIMKK